MNGFRTKHSGRPPHRRKQGAGFYLAMAVCLLAIGAAGWTTVNSLRSLSDLTAPESEASAESKVEAEVKVSGVEASSRGTSSKQESKPTESAAESSPTVSSKPELSVSREPETSKPESAVETNRPILPQESKPVSSVAESKPKPNVTETTFIMPVAGGVLKPYGESEYSMTFEDWRAHGGVDLKASKGATVMAIGEGEVKSFGWDDLLGYVLVIDHSGIEVSYCGLSDKPTVKEGDRVKCGQTIGILADIPSETVEESHLHLEVRVNGERVEPLAAIGKESKLPSEED